MGTSAATSAYPRWLGFAERSGGRRARWSGLHVAAIALAVGVAYYAGSRIGLALRFPPATTSLLWPPNAILTATLLLTRSTRRWWIYLLAALPAHLFMLEATGWPWPFILALFVTNCSEALLAAGAARWLGGAPIRFDTLRRLGFFIATVVLLAPFVSSFADAAVVTWWQGEAFWPVWRTRFVSNALTELMLVPACVVALRDAIPMARRAPWRRFLEGGLLIALTVLLGVIVFGGGGAPGAGSGTSVRFLALLLAPLLWASVRFGPASTSFSLLALTTMLLWAETNGTSFMAAALPPQEGAFAFQTVLAVVAVPLMCLAALMQEHRKAEELVRSRLHFEKLLSRLSTAFVPLASHEMEATFESWVARIGESFDVDRFMVLLLRGEDEVEIAFSWAAPGIVPLGSGIVKRDYPGETQGILRDQLFAIAQLRASRDEGAGPVWLDRAGRVLTVRLATDGPIGVVSVVRRSDDGDWPEELIQRVRLVADVLAGALARKGTEDALRGSEAMKSAILASMPTSVAVLDRRGRLVAVNDEWSRTASLRVREAGSTDTAWDLFDVTGEGARSGTAMASGVRAVLDGSRHSFGYEFVSARGASERWIHMSAVPLKSVDDGGAVVSYSDVTERRRAEIEADHSRQELAHFLRVSTVGVMTTSLAHELNQPLTAILANAQAAQRLLAVEPPDLAEFREVLKDMIDEDKRAGAIISQLRDLLRKGASERTMFEVSGMVGDVARLVVSDALIRDVDLRVELDADTPSIEGDRIQLQQVILNLLLNAFEAAAQSARGRRNVVVTSGKDPAGMALVSVEDTGTGIPPELVERVFEPFFTTKARGMGMGLSIARSIVGAHGGTIWAENAPGGGARFQLRLPAHPAA